jgi:hypothetical protein
MNIVHATWEQRNMGVDCVEITLARTDSVTDEVKDEIAAAETEYTVIKVPSARADLAFMVQDLGFKYIECLISLHRSTALPDVPPMQEKLIGSSDCVLMDAADQERMLEEVRNDMFDTGRVFLDSSFTHEQANERYVGWIKDEIERGTEFYKFRFNGEDAGFFALKQVRSGVLFPFLAGIYPDGPKALGLGYPLCYYEIAQAAKCGARTILGNVSTNNVASLAALTSYGYTVDGMVSVYVKHGEKQ